MPNDKEPKVEKRKPGRPTGYKTEYCKKLIDYFSIEPTREVEKVFIDKSGKEIITYEIVANDMPNLAEFAVKVCDTWPQQLHQWAKKHKEFAEAMNKGKSLQESLWIKNSTSGRYNAATSIFFAKNVLGYKDRIDYGVSGNVSADSAISEIGKRLKTKDK